MALDRSDLRGIARFLVRRFREDALALVAGSLTFNTLFALVPLVTIAVAVFTALPASGRLDDTFRAFVVSNFVPGAASRLITGYTEQFAANASRLTAIGVAMLAVTAIMTMATIDRVFNRIWRVHRVPPFMRRMPVYWAVLTVGPLLVAAVVSLALWLVTESLGLVDARGSRPVILKLLSVLVTCSGLLFLYRAVPNRRVAWSDAAAGAVAAGLVFEAMKAGFASGVSAVGNYKLVYGAFAGFPVFLLWVYLSWLIVLAGAEVAAALPQLRTGAWGRHRLPGGQYLEALALLRLLHQRHREGGSVELPQLARAARLTWDDTEALLQRMAGRGWVEASGQERWLLARDPRALPLSGVFEEFAFQTPALSHEAGRLGLAHSAWEAGPALDGSLSLDAWCRTGTHAPAGETAAS